MSEVISALLALLLGMVIGVGMAYDEATKNCKTIGLFTYEHHKYTCELQQ